MPDESVIFIELKTQFQRIVSKEFLYIYPDQFFAEGKDKMTTKLHLRNDRGSLLITAMHNLR
jgi:hypothetical protein